MKNMGYCRDEEREVKNLHHQKIFTSVNLYSFFDADSGELLLIGGQSGGCPFRKNTVSLPARENVPANIAKRISCLAHLNPPGSTCFVAGKSQNEKHPCLFKRMMVRFTIIFYYLWVDISALTHSQTWFR